MSNRILFAIVAVLVFIFMYSTTSAEETNSLIMIGMKLKAEEAESLEKQVEKDPNDIASRTKLLVYYFRKQVVDQSAREARQKYILWLIMNSPESEILATPYGALNSYMDKEVYSQGKKAWTDQLKKNPDNLKLLENSANYFQLDDRELAEESITKARSLDMNNPKWPEKLGHLYSLGMMIKPMKDRTNAAGKALEQYEIAYKLSTDERRDVLLKPIAEAALTANKPKKAREYAEKMLSQSRPGWNYGNNIHYGNIILGRLALAAGDLEQAKKRLIEAGKTPGSPQLNSFGPSMALAKELLEKDEKDVVLEYFELCSKFWKSERHLQKLKEWSAEVKEGKMPNFRIN